MRGHATKPAPPRARALALWIIFFARSLWVQLTGLRKSWSAVFSIWWQRGPGRSFFPSRPAVDLLGTRTGCIADTSFAKTRSNLKSLLQQRLLAYAETGDLAHACHPVEAKCRGRKSFNNDQGIGDFARCRRYCVCCGTKVWMLDPRYSRFSPFVRGMLWFFS